MNEFKPTCYKLIVKKYWEIVWIVQINKSEYNTDTADSLSLWENECTLSFKMILE